MNDDHPTMTPEEFRDAQTMLGLTDTELAVVLGIDNPQHIRRLKADSNKAHHRVVQRSHVRLLRAYLNGYRPDDWPV